MYEMTLSETLEVAGGYTATWRCRACAATGKCWGETQKIANNKAALAKSRHEWHRHCIK